MRPCCADEASSTSAQRQASSCWLLAPQGRQGAPLTARVCVCVEDRLNLIFGKGTVSLTG